MVYVWTFSAFLHSFSQGEQLQSACIHGLMHLPEVVANLGPLWCHSCFAFEAANGEVLKWFHGSQAVEKQVCLLLDWVFEFVYLHN